MKTLKRFLPTLYCSLFSFTVIFSLTFMTTWTTNSHARSIGQTQELKRTKAKVRIKAKKKNSQPINAQSNVSANVSPADPYYEPIISDEEMMMMMVLMMMSSQGNAPNNSLRNFGGLSTFSQGYNGQSVAPDSSYSRDGQMNISPQGGAKNWPKDWQEHFMKVVNECGPSLYNKEIKGFSNVCPVTGIDTKPAIRKLGMLAFFQNIGWKESNNRSHLKGPVIKSGVNAGKRAVGVLQLSYDDNFLVYLETNEKKGRVCSHCNRSNVQSNGDLLDPKKNIACAVVIANHLYEREGAHIAKGHHNDGDNKGGAAEYWQPTMDRKNQFKDAKNRQDIFNWTAGVCKKLDSEITRADGNGDTSFAGFPKSVVCLAQGTCAGNGGRGLASVRPEAN